jgi:hypothetical protein
METGFSIINFFKNPEYSLVLVKSPLNIQQVILRIPTFPLHFQRHSIHRSATVRSSPRGTFSNCIWERGQLQFD